VLALVALLGAGCGHSGPESGASVTSTTATRSASGGDFGSLHGLCGPGTASGSTARGVTDTEIHLGTMADPTNSVLPGIGQESFDVGDAFVKWCNAAGGILGRKLTLDKRDAKLFDVGARMIDACQSDFMMVGSANPLDEAGVEPRLGCDLAQIPAYVVSAKAARAAEQVVIDSSLPQVMVGHFRALAVKFPDAFKAVSFISVEGATASPSASAPRSRPSAPRSWTSSSRPSRASTTGGPTRRTRSVTGPRPW
jgi:hypothetical protein